MTSLLLTNLLVILAAMSMHPTAQVGAPTQRPTVVARQIEKEREKLRVAFERDLGTGRAQPDDWEDRLDPLVKRASQMTTPFRLKDWNGEELRSLAGIYHFAAQHSLALEAYRKLLTEPIAVENAEAGRQFVRTIEARFRMVQSLIELEQIDEAAAALAELERADNPLPELLAARVLLHRDLATAYRQRLQLEKAALQGLAGFEIGRRISPRALLGEELRDARDVETARLAALSLALLERLGQQKLAEDLQRRWRQTGRGRSAQVEAIFEVELAIQRLIGRPAPELEVKVWIDGSPLTSNALRGKVVLLHFWAMWNSASTGQFAWLNETQEDYRERGFQVIGVTRLFGRSDRRDGLTAEAELRDLESFKGQRKIVFPFAVAGLDDVTNDERFNITALPLLVLIDRDGIVRRVDREASQYRKLGKEIDRLTATGPAVRNN